MNPDFRDILSEFCAANVEFLVVGAYALAAHGLPRATGDIDPWVRPTRENAERVVAALATVTAADFATPGVVFQIGVAPRRVDIPTTIDDVGFEEAWATRLNVELGGLRVNVLGRELLSRNKRAAGRPKDLADASWLEAQDKN